MIIYDKTGAEITGVDTSQAGAVRTIALGGDNNIVLSFQSPQAIELPAQCYINPSKTPTTDTPTDRFYLLDTYKPLDSESGYTYTPKFEHFSALFQQIEFYFEDAQGLRQYSWTLSANLSTAAALIRDAIDREFPEFNVSLGPQASGTALTDLVFDGMNVYEAMYYIAGEFETELWWRGTSLNFNKALFNENTPLELTHTENIQDAITITYDAVRPQFVRPLGGQTNMPVTAVGAISYQGRLPMPEGQETITIEGVDTGVTHNIVNDEIFPTMGGTVGSVAYNGEDDNPIYYIKTDISYKLADVVLPNGEPVVMYFTSGPLAGREFDVDDYGEDGSIEIFRTESNGIYIPRPYLAPSVGDTFLLKNVTIDDTEIAEAQVRLVEWVAEYVEELRTNTPDITAVTNAEYYSVNPRTFLIGESVMVTHPSIIGGVATSRIAGITYDLDDPSLVTLTINDEQQQGRISILEDELKNLTAEVNSEGSTPVGAFDSRYVRKDVNDEVRGELTLHKGLKSPDFQTALRSGFRLFVDELGRGILQLNRVEAEELIVDVLTHNKVQAINGAFVVSHAWAKITRVEVEADGSAILGYKPDDGLQLWRVGDQPRMSAGGRFFWGLVTSVSAEVTQDGEHFIAVSGAVGEFVGSVSKVMEGDEIVLMGHRGADNSRKSATVISAKSEEYPDPISVYSGIDSFSLEGKLQTRIGGDETVIVAEKLVFQTPQGEIVRQPVDRGAFVSGRTYYEYERASLNGSLWQCVVESTTVAPSEGASEWVAVVDAHFGGVNLLNGTALKTNPFNRGEVTESGRGSLMPPVADTMLWQYYVTEGSGDLYTNAAFSYELEANCQYVFTIYVAGTSAVTNSSYVFTRGVSSGYYKSYAIGITNNGQWERKSIVITTPSENVTFTFRMGAKFTGTAWIACAAPMLEKGNKASESWREAPIDGKTTMAEELGYDSYEELKEVASKGQTVIKGGYLNTSLIEAEAIDAEMINVATLIVQRYLSADEQVAIDENGILSIRDDHRIDRVVLFPSNISTIADIESGGGEGSVATPAKTFSSAEQVILGSLYISKGGASVSVSTTISISAQAFEDGSEVESYLSLVIQNASGVAVAHVGTVSANIIAGESSQSETKQIDFRFTASTVQTYRLVAIYSKQTQGLVTASANVFTGTFSWEYVANVVRTEIGIDGNMCAINSEAFDHVKWNGKELVRTFRGIQDVSGVLMAGTISSAGAIGSSYFHYKKSSIATSRLSTGKYRIIHNLGHLKYSCVTTLYTSTFAGVMRIKNKTSTYVDIEVLDVLSAFRDAAFEFTISGFNYVS